MNDPVRLHRKAMELADEAMQHRRMGDVSTSKRLFQQAFEMEAQAARAFVSDYSHEPTRSVLYRSAASLGIQCGALRQAEQMVGSALAGEPPDEIADELRGILSDIQFQRHFGVANTGLAVTEIQLTLLGPAVGHGIALASGVTMRVQALQVMIHHAVMQRFNVPYRGRSKLREELKQEYQVFLTAPRAASYVVSMRVGDASAESRHEQNSLIPDILDSILVRLGRLNEGRMDDFSRHMDDYSRAFVRKAVELAPDGKNVTAVGLLCQDGLGPKQLAFTVTREQLGWVQEGRPAAREVERVEQGLDAGKPEPATSLPIAASEHLAPVSATELSGTLVSADLRSREIVLDDAGLSHRLVAGDWSVIRDTVARLWGRRCTVSIRRDGGRLVVVSMRAADA